MASWALLRNWTSLLQECKLFCLLHPCLGGYLIWLSEPPPPQLVQVSLKTLVHWAQCPPTLAKEYPWGNGQAERVPLYH